MSDIWAGATWNENGELVLDIYATPEPEPEYEEFDDDEYEHTYATIDCGGECEKCIALIVDGDVVSGPPFHPNCDCKLTDKDIKMRIITNRICMMRWAPTGTVIQMM